MYQVKHLGPEQPKHLIEFNFTLTCKHQNNRSKDIKIEGMLIDNQYITYPLVILNLEGKHPMMANSQTSMDIAWASDTPLGKSVQAHSNLITNNVLKHYSKNPVVKQEIH